MNKLLVIQTASIGDVILATSLLEELHYNYPSARIDFLVKKGNESLFEEHPFLNKVLVWNKKEGKYKNLINLIKEIRKVEYDAVINVQRFFSSGLITTLSKGKRKIGFKKNPMSMFFDKKVEHIIDKNNFVHEINRNFELISDICLNDDSDVLNPVLYPTKQVREKVSKYKTGIYYTVSPASLWYTKQFYKGGWIEFLKQISQDRLVYLLGGNSDKELCQDIIDETGNQNIRNLSGELSFLESASLMKDAKMNFVNDSAPLHFCTSVNAPVTAIFCSTVPEFGFTPLSSDSKIIQTHKQLDCKPCGLHGYRECPKNHFDCSKTIDIKELVNRL